ncbi:T9SS type A sorting domain-containing protein, partial [Pseudopedobacter beijingensis]
EATTNGGGMYNWDQSSPVLTDVVVSNNTANTNGGGIVNNKNSSPVLTNITLNGNTANTNGGGMYNSGSSPVLTNVTLNGNTASDGGGMHNTSSSPVLTNVTLSGNTADVVGGGMSNFGSSSPKVYNSIIWGNTKVGGATINNIFNDNSTPEFYHSLVQGGGSSTSWNSSFGNDGGDNIDSNPLFTDVANGDYSLANGSPAIDKGNNGDYTDKGNGDLANDLDLAGNLRVYDYDNGGIIDMGAYEYQGGTLPVHLGRFNARVENSGVKLEWNTLSEYNNQSFIIYRSADGVNYSPITWEPGKGNGPHVYVVFDNQPLNGINYYRLVQTDHDGKQTILGERSLTFEIPDSMIRLYPNPFRDAFTIDFETDAFKQLLVLDVTGKVLQQLAIASLESSKTVSMAGYPSGTYLVVLKGITNVVTRKVVKE